MAKEKANRKRCVQVKFRLTPEENAVLQKDVKDSGLSKNDYIIKTIINRVGLSVLSCERRYCSNSVDIHFMLANKRIGYASCLFFRNIKKVQVSSFYVIKPFQDIGIEEKLLQEILDYAELNQAEGIIAYPGAEPYCPTEWKPIDTQTAWYETNGFTIDHMVSGATPCMVKQL
jgi:GNAT superfamily N-acetyltransferase